jgi:hypothetical protein
MYYIDVSLAVFLGILFEGTCPWQSRARVKPLVYGR